MDDTNNLTTPSTEPPTENGAAVPPDINPPDPEAERLRAENTELKQEIRIRDARERMTELRAAAEAASPDLLFDAVRGELQFSDDGELQNAAALLARLKTRFPEQFERKPPVGSIDGGAGTGSPRQPVSAAMLGRMTPAQIQKLDWAEVKRVLSSEF
ncbi:MAG: hypothetical protein AB7Q37_11280 [Pyrinomonadaceae bacterium]